MRKYQKNKNKKHLSAYNFFLDLPGGKLKINFCYNKRMSSVLLRVPRVPHEHKETFNKWNVKLKNIEELTSVHSI